MSPGLSNFQQILSPRRLATRHTPMLRLTATSVGAMGVTLSMYESARRTAHPVQEEVQMTLL